MVWKFNACVTFLFVPVYAFQRRVWCNIGMVYVISYHSHLLKNTVIHVPYIEESKGMKLFIWSLFKISVHIVNLNYADLISFNHLWLENTLWGTGPGDSSVGEQGGERATWRWTCLTSNPSSTAVPWGLMGTTLLPNLTSLVWTRGCQYTGRRNSVMPNPNTPLRSPEDVCETVRVPRITSRSCKEVLKSESFWMLKFRKWLLLVILPFRNVYLFNSSPWEKGIWNSRHI